MLPLLLVGKKLEHRLDFRDEHRLRLEDLPGPLLADPGPVEEPMGLGDGFHRARDKAAAPQGDDVHAARSRRRPLAEHVRGHVMENARQPGHERVAADRGPVVHGHAPGERGMGMDADMPPQERAVGDDHAVADLAVVRDMTAGHEEVAAPHDGHAVFLLRGPVDRHPFADDVVVANLHARVAAAVADILRIGTDDGIGKDPVAGPDPHAPHHRDMILEDRAGADRRAA